jgi:hypothetical protein
MATGDACAVDRVHDGAADEHRGEASVALVFNRGTRQSLDAEGRGGVAYFGFEHQTERVECIAFHSVVGGLSDTSAARAAVRVRCIRVTRAAGRDLAAAASVGLLGADKADAAPCIRGFYITARAGCLVVPACTHQSGEKYR